MKGLITKYGYLFLMGMVISFLASSCSSTKYLQEGETFLDESKIEFNTKEKIENKSNLKYNLTSQILQQPNGNTLFFIPKEWMYYRNSAPGDSSWYNNFFRNYMGEPPAIFSNRKTEESAYIMQNYLVNKKGYYNAKVDFDVQTEKQKTKVKYSIDPGPRYKINSIEYYGNDKDVLQVMEEVRSEAVIKPGDPIDASTFDLELTRLSLALQNNGYANFATNYFQIKGDSSLNKNAVDVFLELRPPLPDSLHQKYTIGNINVYTDYHRNQQIAKLDSATFNSSIFYKQGEDYLVRPSTLNNLIFLEPGTPYKRDARTKTRTKLAELGTYRFVTMDARTDAEHDSILHYDIFLTPYNNQWVADFGSDIFFSTINQSNRRLFGFSLNSQFKNRNLLGGAEQLTISSEAGLEIQVNPEVQIRTASAGLNAALEIPKQVDLFGLAKTMKGIGIIGSNRYQKFRENTTTTIAAGYNFVNVFDSYSRSSLNASYSYNFRPSTTSRFVIRQLALEYNDYELKEQFLDFISENPLLLRSFEDNLLTGFLFRDITYVHTTPVNNNGNSRTFISSLEVSGWETYIVNQTYNAIAGSDEIWKLNNNIGFSKYIRAEIDQRFNKFFRNNQSLVFRGYAGIVVPYGGDIATPYFKQFSVGGPNSMRGWDQKELGPGSYSELLLEPVDGQTFFQTGDIKLEMNLEYRFDIFYIFEGALFADAGNVWTLKENEDRPGSKFEGDFYDEIAINLGYGIRFDFDYFNIRFDFGYKLRDPYAKDDNGRHWYTWNEFKSQNFGNFQVAVNYPF